MNDAPEALPAIAFLGAGSMGGAILRGLVASGIPVDGGVRAVNRTEAKAAALREPGVVSLSFEEVDDATEQALRGAKLVVLGVKPVGIPALLEEIAPLLEPDAVIVSIAAGVTIATMEAIVPNPVVRTMPNTPSMVGRGIAGIAGGSRATASVMALVSRLFETVGRVVVLPEDRINALSAISGSGPAYFYFFVEALAEAARRIGFDDADARSLAEGTFTGAAALLEASGEDPARLRRNVTSPKGSTERAIAVFESADLPAIYTAAAEAAVARAEEMARGA